MWHLEVEGSVSVVLISQKLCFMNNDMNVRHIGVYLLALNFKAYLN